MAERKVVIHSADEIAGIRRAARVTADVLDELCRAVVPGMSTGQLDQLAGSLIRQRGGESAFYQYRGFPGQICISVNDEVVHGIGRPDRLIQPGDLVSLDVGVRLDDCIGDTARTVAVGEIDSLRKRLLAVTREALMAGIRAAEGSHSVWHIGSAVESTVLHAGFSVVRDFVGHGVGTSLHEAPEVPNYPRREFKKVRLQPGMVLAIEPMVNSGRAKIRVDDADHWTVRTVDGSCSAHFEHMVLITPQQAEVLTWPTTA